MAVQNAYNNYIKRKTNGVAQAPTNNFKEKVKNSLGGVPTKPTQGTSANTPIVNTPPTTAPNSVAPASNINTPTTTQSASRGIVDAPIDTPAPIANQNVTTPTPVANQNTPTPTSDVPTGGEMAEGQGLMSMSEIEGAFTPATASANPEGEPVSVAEINEVASDPNVSRMARSTGKTPQQLAQELLEQQKAQLQKDWELKQQELKQQQEQAQNGFNQSVSDAEKTYDKSIETINKNRYDQQQQLNVSGSNRGIQYSPQQLGIENVANINTNNNITEAGKQRSELLNKLQQQINELNANILLGSQNSVNEYNKALAQLQSDYQQQMMSWEWDDKKTQEEREWQQSQTQSDREWNEKQQQADREWQEKMDALDKEWQGNQNQLDRDKYGKSSGGSSRGYSSSYTPYSRSYNSRSGYSGGNYMGGVDLNDEITQQTIDNDFKNLSTDAFNATKGGGMSDLMERAGIYNDAISPMYDAFYGGNNVVDERLDNTRETALGTMYNRAYKKDTNTPHQIGQTVYENKRPLREEYIDKVKRNEKQAKSDFYDKYSKNETKKTKLKSEARTEQRINKLTESLDKVGYKRGDKTHNDSLSKTKQKQSKSNSKIKNTSPLKQNSTTTAKNKLESSTKSNSKSTTSKNNKKSQNIPKPTKQQKKANEIKSNKNKYKSKVKEAVSKVFKKKK